MFSYTTFRLDNNLSLSVGLKFDLKGELIYGSPKEDIALFKKLSNYIKDQSSSENIVIDLTLLTEWHSIALKEFIPQISAINKEHLTTNKRTPVSIVGSKSGDVYWAVEEKHKAELESGTIPWFTTFEEYKQKNTKLSITNSVLIKNPL